MSAPPRKPTALDLGNAMMAVLARSSQRVGMIKGGDDGNIHIVSDKRDTKVPQNMKKVYTQIPHHQGAKERARRLRQMAREGKK